MQTASRGARRAPPTATLAPASEQSPMELVPSGELLSACHNVRSWLFVGGRSGLAPLPLIRREAGLCRWRTRLSLARAEKERCPHFMQLPPRRSFPKPITRSVVLQSAPLSSSELPLSFLFSLSTVAFSHPIHLLRSGFCHICFFYSFVFLLFFSRHLCLSSSSLSLFWAALPPSVLSHRAVIRSHSFSSPLLSLPSLHQATDLMASSISLLLLVISLTPLYPLPVKTNHRDFETTPRRKPPSSCSASSRHHTGY